MATTPLRLLKPGMALDADLASPDGKYRLPAGLILTEAHLRLLSAWHVGAADIRPEAPAAAPAEDPLQPKPHEEPRLSAEDRMRRRFEHASPSEAIPAALLDLALARTDRLPAPPAKEPPEPHHQKEGPIPTPEAIIAGDPTLVSLPEVFMRIREVVTDPTSTAEDAAAIIGKDPSLTAKLLKLVNSAFYARTMRIAGSIPPGRVDTLSRAVMLLGLNQLSTLAMGVSVLPLFKDIPAAFIDMKLFWKHSVAVGLLAKELSVRLNDPSPERYFVAGLLHDIGRLILYKHTPALAGKALREAARQGKLLVEVERELYGWDHAVIGGMLLRKWRFPVGLEQAVWHHHDPASGEVAREPALVNVADMVAGALLPGTSGERLIPRFMPEAWKAAEIMAEELPGLIETVEGQFEEVYAMFS